MTFSSDKNVRRDAYGFIGVPDPEVPEHAASKHYVDEKIATTVHGGSYRMIRDVVPYIRPTLQGTWVDYPGGGYIFHRGSYYRTSEGIVCLSGLIAGGATTSTIFNLPVGYRPDSKHLFPAFDSKPGTDRVDVFSSGDVGFTGSSTGYVSLSGIMFPAAGVATWTPITFASGWTSYHTVDATWPPAAYWRDPLGRVWFRGLARQTTPSTLAADTKMFTLPFSKNLLSHYPSMCYPNVFASLDMRPNGTSTDVYAKTGVTTNWVGLSMAQFPDDAMASNWQQQSAYLNGWDKYPGSSFPNRRWLQFDDGIVMQDGLITGGTLGAFVQGIPVGTGPDLEPWTDDSMHGSEMFTVVSNLAAGRLDATVTDPSNIAGAQYGWVAVSGSNTWYSFGGVNYVAGA